MKNRTVKDIMEYARQRLLSAYGSVGVADGDDIGMLTVFDEATNESIKIEITIKRE